MNIYDFCERFRISQAKARKMEKAGVLNLDTVAAGNLDAMLDLLRRGKPLTAMQLVELIETPATLIDLGRYAGDAKGQIDALGPIEPAPREIAAHVTEAAKGDADALAIVLAWIHSIVPDKPVSHAHIAVRLILALPESIRKYDVPRIPRLMLNCRKHPDFAGWWRLEKRKGRNVTIYQKPLANHDL